MQAGRKTRQHGDAVVEQQTANELGQTENLLVISTGYAGVRYRGIEVGDAAKDREVIGHRPAGGELQPVIDLLALHLEDTRGNDGIGTPDAEDVRHQVHASE